MAVQNRRWRRSVRGRLERGEKRREAGRGAVNSGGGARLLQGSGEHRGGVAGRVNAGVDGFNAIEEGEGLRGELREREKEGEVVTTRWHPRHGAGRRSVAGKR
jgi:hypothetical protein